MTWQQWVDQQYCLQKLMLRQKPGFLNRKLAHATSVPPKSSQIQAGQTSSSQSHCALYLHKFQQPLSGRFVCTLPVRANSKQSGMFACTLPMRADSRVCYGQRVPSLEGPLLKLTKMTTEEKAAYELEQKAARGASIVEAAGFATVMEAMRDSGKPGVGHNCIFDVAYVLESFAQPLPESWTGELIGF